MAAALARSISRAMTVAFAADDAPTTRLCFGDVHTRNVEAHVCDDARPVSLRVAHITKSLNITHTRTRRGGGGGGACSLALAYDGCCDRGRCRIDGACALVVHTRAPATRTCAMLRASCHSGLLTLRHRKNHPRTRTQQRRWRRRSLAQSRVRWRLRSRPMAHGWRVRGDGAHTRVVDADVRGDARPVSLRVAYVTVSLNITHTRACCGA